jgi:membrane-associated phospholipid phosphatase
MTLAYLATNYWTDYRNPYNVYTWFEQQIPLIPSFVYVYCFVYIVLVALPVFLIKDKKQYYQLLSKIIVITIVSAFIFIIFPTTTNRPILNDSSWSSFLLMNLYVIDSPHNCCPSLHVSLATILALTLHLKNYWKTYPLIIAVLVILSTLFTKQHCLIDIMGGIAAASITWIIIERNYHGWLCTKARKYC